jgi:hypothetical protein
LKPIRWSAHAEASLRDRDIDRDEAERTLANPDRRIASVGQRAVLVRRYDDRIVGRPMVLCVVVEDAAQEVVVITAYKSSKLDKYLAGGTA